jgi:hypothetical protein
MLSEALLIKKGEVKAVICYFAERAQSADFQFID